MSLLQICQAHRREWATSLRSDPPRRRSFTAKYKLDMLAEHGAADPAARAVLLRREGLYSSHLSEWRKVRDSGAALTPAARSGKKSGEQVENANLRGRAERERAKIKAVLEIVGRAHQVGWLASDPA